MLFTKVYKEEDVRLRGCSYNVASVYFHLKNKRDYFKSKNNGSCYDLTKHISKNTGMCERTIKRAIATLRELGLISTTLKGKVNHYSFPILDAIENNTPIEEVVKDIPSKPNKKEIEPNPYIEQNIEDNNDKENNIEDMGNLIGYIKEPVQVAATAHTPNAFQDFLKESAFTINDIIEDFKAGGIRAKIQAPDRLKVLLNTKFGKVYKEEIEEYIKARVNTPNKADLSPSNIKEVEEPQPLVEKPTEGLKIAKNEEKQSIPLKITASEDFRPTEKLQDLINNDDNFCTIYTRCINYIADYKLNPGDFIKSNSKNMAFSRLERLFEESGIPYNEDIKNFINDDVEAKITILEKIA